MGDNKPVSNALYGTIDTLKRQPALRWRILRFFVRVIVSVVLVVGGFAGYQYLTWPDVTALAHTNPTTTAFIERYREQALDAGENGDVRWDWVHYRDIATHLKNAVIVSEDIEFFEHEGFSSTEIRAAIEEALEQGEAPRGASTLTQQVAKNLWLSPSRNPWRKAKEALLTVQLERHLEKERILEIHLNVAQFGPGIFGVGAAARHYFAKPASDLTRWEAALLAASLPRPTTWHPGVQDNRYLGRADRIEFLTYEYQDFLWRRLGDPRGEFE
ncbi:MAG: monofunctional biosynthetic peptidoglycan transglycosylase [Gemmatimonadetes bacterium]|nr:monofunctional biosynthetic peptidoglycan transglycosylase [Gemmatimonadota bacterium]